jgi:circadian clock protein KaiB
MTMNTPSRAEDAPLRFASVEEFEREMMQRTPRDGLYELRLYVSGSTPRSAKAVENITRICEQFLKGRYALEIVDVYQQPELARDKQLVAAPTLVKSLPRPERRIVGDMSNEERVLIGLDLRRRA